MAQEARDKKGRKVIFRKIKGRIVPMRADGPQGSGYGGGPKGWTRRHEQKYQTIQKARVKRGNEFLSEQEKGHKRFGAGIAVAGAAAYGGARGASKVGKFAKYGEAIKSVKRSGKIGVAVGAGLYAAGMFIGRQRKKGTQYAKTVNSAYEAAYGKKGKTSVNASR